MPQIEAIATDETRAVAPFERLRFRAELVRSACGPTEADGGRFWRLTRRKALVKGGGCRRQFRLTAGTSAQ